LRPNDHQDICFAAEATLGKLAKWLRILGFDTDYQPAVSAKRFIDSAGAGKKRILLTRTKLVRDQGTDRRLVFITSNDPLEQLKEVIQVLGIVPQDIRPFSRCTRCNILIQLIDRDAVHDRVPDYVWQSNTRFQICSQCRRIYWPGSHIKQSCRIIERLFI